MHIWYTCENPWGLPSGVITFTRFSERLTFDPKLEIGSLKFDSSKISRCTYGINFKIPHGLIVKLLHSQTSPICVLRLREKKLKTGKCSDFTRFYLSANTHQVVCANECGEKAFIAACKQH